MFEVTRTDSLGQRVMRPATRTVRSQVHDNVFRHLCIIFFELLFFLLLFLILFYYALAYRVFVSFTSRVLIITLSLLSYFGLFLAVKFHHFKICLFSSLCP